MLLLFHDNLKKIYVFNDNKNSKYNELDYLRRRLFTLIFLFIISIQMASAEENNSFFKSDSCSIFTSKVYKTIIEEVNGNIISSPISIHLLLSFLSHGAKGKTADELIDNLYIEDFDQLSTEYKNFISTLNNIEKVELHIANSAYLHDNVQLLPKISALGIDFYNFAVSKINLQDNVKVADQINKWIMEKTKNKINDIINSDDITADTRMILVNAIYFKGLWKFPFSRKDTTNEPFYLTKENYKLVPIMKKKIRYAHGELPQMNSRFIEIPYTNENLSMVIILPNEIEGLNSLEQNFDWNSIVNAEPSHQEIIIHLPRFTIESTLNLKSILNKIGIKTMFENTANFSGMTETPVKVSKVIQKAFLEINEEGCEAAAATVMKIRLRRMIEDPEVFLVDHPFLVAIRHKDSNIPLFIGRVQDIDVNRLLLSDKRDEL
ncbi:ovalbumin-related protein X-like [Chelonus insularis]|uniref:ovalbumin-related protein X-like n=1 Tax=Chelonus insularis TaxID=460826 RepID=UPI00158898AF|nr:ovalbumin-related protein X-like [Chelonus insularis]